MGRFQEIVERILRAYGRKGQQANIIIQKVMLT